MGFTLLGIGTMITMLGISLFFNKTLMTMGNLCWIAGIPITLGPTRTMGYLLQPEKFRATACLAVGIFLVLLVRKPVLGIILECFGILNLFGNMFPVVLAIAKTMPIIGPILSGNGGNNNTNRYGQRRSQRDDDYDNDYHYYEEEEDRRRGSQNDDYYNYYDRRDDDRDPYY
jgi:hypothetical protein